MSVLYREHRQVYRSFRWSSIGLRSKGSEVHQIDFDVEIRGFHIINIRPLGDQGSFLRAVNEGDNKRFVEISWLVVDTIDV